MIILINHHLSRFVGIWLQCFKIHMRYAIPEKSTQLIEYYWDCILVIGLRPESVHTQNGLDVSLILPLGQ